MTINKLKILQRMWKCELLLIRQLYQINTHMDSLSLLSVQHSITLSNKRTCLIEEERGSMCLGSTEFTSPCYFHCVPCSRAYGRALSLLQGLKLGGWHMPMTQAFGRHTQKDQWFDTRLSYIVSSRLAWATENEIGRGRESFRSWVA